MASNLPCPIRHNVLKRPKSSASPIEAYIEVKEKLKRLQTLVSALYQVKGRVQSKKFLLFFPFFLPFFRFLKPLFFFLFLLVSLLLLPVEILKYKSKKRTKIKMLLFTSTIRCIFLYPGYVIFYSCVDA